MNTSDIPPPTTNGSTLPRTSSISQASGSSQTAQDYITSQLRLEADAREALPYQFDTCTKPLGPLRQSVFACLTCTPPPASQLQQFTPAGICYSCSISCHGEHTLVELFTKRDFECDCGTTRLANSGTPCSLRHNATTGRKGYVLGEGAREGNKYNHNYEGKFCGCGEEYDPDKEKGTMFQCLGLGTVEDDGCGEDWWHPECLMGLPRNRQQDAPGKVETNGTLETVQEEVAPGEEAATNGDAEAHHDTEPPLPPGFPAEDDFDHLICYKCTDAFPWIKQYAGTPGFLPAVSAEDSLPANGHAATSIAIPAADDAQNKKRKAEADVPEPQDPKKVKQATPEASSQTTAPATATNGHTNAPRHKTLPTPPPGRLTLFLQDSFRKNLCRCTHCFPHLNAHPHLEEEEEDAYEPPLSEGDAGAPRSVNSGSLLERGEAALSSMDRVRAIEGVMAYNHVKDKVKEFLRPFAESGELVGAEEIRAYFAGLRGDEMGGRKGTRGMGDGGVGGGEDRRREQGGY